MITVTDDVLQQMVQAIVREVDPEQIWLFGSRARGEGGPDSDVDLLVVEREPFGPGRSRWDEISRLYSAIIPFRAPVDILLYSRDEVERYRGWMNHVVATVLGEGKLLYERV
jgi:predicted nucleotidyltransferase